MPSRLALGSSTKASARLEALLRVMVRLSCMSQRGEGVTAWTPEGRRSAAEAIRPSRPTWGCGGDVRGGGGTICGVAEGQRRRRRQLDRTTSERTQEPDDL